MGAFLVLLLIALVFALVAAGEEPSSHASDIEILPTEGLNLKIIGRHGIAGVDVAPVRPNPQWFAATFTCLPIDYETTIRICMAGNDTRWNIADCRKWVGLRPMMTYADPTRYESYVGYSRDADGRWVSDDLFACGDARYAGFGLTPAQDVIPPALAEQFLTGEGSRWFPWRELPAGEADTTTRTFTIRARFAQERATVAIHVPYTVTYLDAFLARLRAAQLPGVSVDVIGATAEGRPLRVVRVDDIEHPTPLRLNGGTLPRIDDPPGADTPRVMIMVAREHGTEHTPGWVMQGMLRALVADTPESRRLRAGTTWLLLLMVDPDGVANGVFDTFTDHIFPHEDHPRFNCETPPEILAYVRYLRAFVNSGRLVANITAFYGAECNELQPVVCPAAITLERDLLFQFNRYWFARLKRRSIITSHPKHNYYQGTIPYRLHGWARYHYGAFSVSYQVNDRYPKQRFKVCDLEQIGGHYAETLVDFLSTPPGLRRTKETRQFMNNRARERELWFHTSMAGTPEDPTLYDLLTMGY